jgi:twitching motility protein PilT
MRKLSTKIPTCEGLNLAPVFKEIIKEKNGIIFVTGATGSGKTTTLAAMLNELNLTSEMHIVTLEDPIEFLHPHLKATFSQRELGKDFSDFSVGLRAALRQAPKVILVGEIRDRDTMEIALTAAETGHVVFSTLHTISAAQSVNRVIGMFSSEEEPVIRQRLADTLRYVISQRLAPKVGGGRIMACEIMGSNLRTRETILLGENEIRSFHEIIEASTQNGWGSFEQCLVRLFKDGTITEETAFVYSVNKSVMRKAIDLAKKEMGTQDNSPIGFKLIHHDEHKAPAIVNGMGPGLSSPPALPVGKSGAGT